MTPSSNSPARVWTMQIIAGALLFGVVFPLTNATLSFVIPNAILRSHLQRLASHPSSDRTGAGNIRSVCSRYTVYINCANGSWDNARPGGDFRAKRAGSRFDTFQETVRA